ncbi:hypothetical protein B0H17DRAFT_1164394 [Mycena rosella]|uniref:Metallo-beta-lactamase domain-containing protein n=1 Tax=Mycena rosella TaxID=1033263 RepID=A0AAD7FI47_MYCRO|nr:hypothetical protein B0H17DRAFT_1164394 [Mycena rosella]
MSESFQTLGIPASSSTVTVKAFNLVNDPSKVSISASLFLDPPPVPAFAFLIENARRKRRVMFDLGPRKDLENAAPSLAEAFKAGALDMPMKRDIVEQLTDNGVDLKSISAVIWRRVFDMIQSGDMSKFPSSTELVFGQEMVRATYVTDPSSTLLESDLAYGGNLVAVDFASSQLEFAGFKVHDFFGDGSLYLLDVPGHLPGHLCALARVTPTSFLFLGGDAEFDLTARTTPLLDVADNGYYTDPPTARTSIGKMGSFDANKDVFVMLAHDESLMSVVGPFPALLDAWQAKGWKELVTWAFLDEKNPAFRFNTKAKA